jgi:hypothetical protein
MYLRDLPGKTVKDVADAMEAPPGQVVRVEERKIKFHLTAAEPAIAIDTATLPVRSSTIETLADWAEVPTKWLMRQSPTLQEAVLNHVFDHRFDNASVRFDENTVYEVTDPKREGKAVEPRRLVDVASKVIAPSAEVVAFDLTQDNFGLDIIVPDGFDRGIGGDKPTARRVGDLTKAGLRFGHNRKRNLAPWVQPYFYRLICTNGMEMPDNEMKVSAQGQSVDEVIMEIELAAQRAMGAAEDRIRHFYEMREQRVATPEQALLRIGEERALPDRTVQDLLRRVPTITDADGNTTMFDLVNLVTNQANEPSIRSRSNSSRALEVAGGGVVSDHVERCNHCQSRLLN